MDPVFSIREEAANALIQISKSTYDREWLSNLVANKVDEFSRHQTFMIRIHSIHLMNSMREHVNPLTVKQKFAATFVKLADDPVPNIRFNVSKSVKAHWKLWGRETQMNLESHLKRMSEHDSDFDAKFFAMKALEEVGLAK